MSLAAATNHAAPSLDRLADRLAALRGAYSQRARRTSLEARLVDAIRRQQAPELIEALRRALRL